MSEVLFSELRAAFPATEGQAYLNTPTSAPAPRAAREAVQQALDAWSGGRCDWHAWESAGEAARAGFARLLGVAPGTVALLPTVSLAAGQVAQALPAAPGANVVVPREEFRSNLFPWLALERRGFELRAVPGRGGAVAVEDLVAAIDRRTALVAVSSVQSATGWRVELEPLAAAARRAGALVFVDATQSLGALPLEVGLCDFVACAGYKWLLSPRGTAYLHVAPGRLELLQPLAPGWKSAAAPHASYYGPPLELAPDAARLDQSLAWLAWAGAPAGLELLEAVGLQAVARHDLELARAFGEGLLGLGLAPLFGVAHPSPIVAFEVADAAAVERELAAHEVRAAVRAGRVRVGFHLFNDGSDVERALAALRAALRAARGA